MEDPPEIETPEPPAQVVDVRGHRCPTPTLRLRRALEAIGTGQRVLLLADDPMARIDVPHFIASRADLLVESREEGGALHFLVEKG